MIHSISKEDIYCHIILNSQVVSLPLQFEIQEVANFCAAMDTLMDQDGVIVWQCCFLSFQISTRSAVRPQIQWAVNKWLQMATLSSSRVCMSQHTHFNLQRMQLDGALGECKAPWQRQTITPYFLQSRSARFVAAWQRASMNVGPWWWKANPKVSRSLPAPRSGHATNIMVFLLIYSSYTTQIAGFKEPCFQQVALWTTY